MRVTTFFLTIFVIVVNVIAGNGEFLSNLQGTQGIRIKCVTPKTREFLHRYEGLPGFNFIGSKNDTMDILVSACQLNMFKNLLKTKKINHEVFIENVRDEVAYEFTNQLTARKKASIRNRFQGNGFSFTYYPNYDEIISTIQEIAKENGDVVTLQNIGSSFEGRAIYVVKISSGGRNNPGILIDAGIHAREWIAPVTALYFIDQLATNKSNRYLLDNIDYYIIPILNPDGYEFTHSSIDNRFWRKTRSKLSGSTCYGVDGNRNFDVEWMVSGSSQVPCADTYAGPSPFSEPETRALRDYVFANKNIFKAYLTFHSYGQYLLYPWGYGSEPAKNKAELDSLAKSIAQVIFSVSGTRYTFGQSAVHLYPAAGGSDDWAMGAAGISLSYTIELPGGGSYGFDLPPNEIKRVGKETFEALKFYGDYVKMAESSWVWPDA